MHPLGVLAAFPCKVGDKTFVNKLGAPTRFQNAHTNYELSVIFGQHCAIKVQISIN